MQKLPPEENRNPEDKYNLSSIGGQDIESLPINPSAEMEADLHLKNLEKGGMSRDQIAELTWLTRLELFSMLKEALPAGGSEDENPDAELSAEPRQSTAPSGETAPGDAHAIPTPFTTRKERIKTLLGQDRFQKKIAWYKKLLGKSGDKMQEELNRHQDEQKGINGYYHQYKNLTRIKTDLELSLGRTMARLFSQRGKDPDSMLVETRLMLEEAIASAEGQMAALKKEKPDVAALIQFDKMKNYSDQLKENDFIWTESRKQLLEEALKKVVAGRPMIILMGESGTGKTAMAHAIARQLTGKDALREVGGAESRFKDSLAARAIDDQGSYYDFGPILQAMTGMKTNRDKKPQNEGAVYFDDEFNTRPAGVQRQILKFIADAKPGREITVPGTDLKVKVQQKFLYIAAGNPPSARYEREETPVEAYREVAGIIDVDYLEQTKDRPELMELMAACLMDQKTRRLRLLSEDDCKPAFIKDASTGKESVDEKPHTGGFLWRYANAWKEILNAFSQKENALTKANPADPPEKYHLQKFILDVGKVRGWLGEYKASRKEQRNGIEAYLTARLADELKSYPAEDIETVKAFFQHFGIDLREPGAERITVPELTVRPPTRPFKVMTPKEAGYLFPNVPRPAAVKKTEAPSPKTRIAILPDGTEVEYEETLPQELAQIGNIGDEVKHKQNKKLYKLLGQAAKGEIVIEAGANNEIMLLTPAILLQNYEPSAPEVPKEHRELMKNLEVQYNKRLKTLKYFELIDDEKKPEITGIDNRKYPAPTMAQIRSAITPVHLEKINKHIRKPKLLIVPFALPIKAIAAKIGAKNGKLTKQNPVYTYNWDIDADLPGRPADKEQMVYLPDIFDPQNHGGMTKTILLQAPGGYNRFPGWQVLVVDGEETVPPDTLNKSANEILAEYIDKRLDGLTNEDWLVLHAEGVVDGLPFDNYQKNSTSWFLGSYLPKSGSVPFGGWTPDYSKAYLFSNTPTFQSFSLGCRPAVRIF